MREETLAGERVLVIGLERTGQAVAHFLLERSAKPVLVDRRGDLSLPESLASRAESIYLGPEDPGSLLGVALVVASPGVPRENPLLKEARKRGVPVWSEIELASRFLAAPLVAVTGTNGKSTTVTLIGEILESAGRRVFVGGNIGRPLIGYVNGEWDLGVVEVSSFQLEWVDRFCPRIGALLNITPDHLDRYSGMDEYARTKFRLFANQTGREFALVNRDDPQVWSRKSAINGSLVSFGRDEVGSGVFVQDAEIGWRWEDREERFSLAKVRLRGLHNVENVMAAVAITRLLGIPREIIQKSLDEFAGLEHRLEFVRERRGVNYYNDSKATNLGSVIKSLASFAGPILLLAGGRDKGGGYEAWKKLVRDRVRRLILFGEAREAIRGALEGSTEVALVRDLAEAVQEAALAGRPGDTVLLSPGCSSFDMFRNYEERGRLFKELVWALN